MIDAKATERFMTAPWLAEVDPEIKKAICDVLVEARAPAGATLLAQGQPNDHLTFLIEGTAVVERGFHNGHRESIIPLNAPRGVRHHFIFPTDASDGYRACHLGRLDSLALSPCP